MNRYRSLCFCGRYAVSIPFKREGTCELYSPRIYRGIPKKFQFPSNGKARANVIGKLFRLTLVAERFNSLQTGRHVRTELWENLSPVMSKFQFPSNGKARVNAATEVGTEAALEAQEFQFPSNGKARVNANGTDGICRWMCESFNSLQTGRHV